MPNDLPILRAAIAAAALALVSCASEPPPPAAPSPRLTVLPAAWKSVPAEDLWTTAEPAEHAARGAWWKVYGDTELDRLVDRAGRHNTDLQLAALRLEAARALVAGAEAARAPQLTLGAGAQRARLEGRTDSAVRAATGVSYEVDLLGRLRRGADAARLDARAQEALLQSMRLIVQADVAQALLALRAADAERQLLQETLVSYEETLLLVARRVRAGDLSELDVARLQAEVAATRAEALALDRHRGVLENALALLVGESASSFRVEPSTAIHWAQTAVPAGLPSTLLARRPDVAAALHEWAASQSRVGIAERAWFPRLVLTGEAGAASSDLADLVRGSARAWSLGALLSMPLLDGGRRGADLALARTEREAAAVRYQGRVLVAFQEVEDQLSALQHLDEQGRAQQEAVHASARATALSQTRWRNGLVSQLELLDAQRGELRARREALRVVALRSAAGVALVRALGGGWEPNR